MDCDDLCIADISWKLLRNIQYFCNCENNFIQQ